MRTIVCYNMCGFLFYYRLDLNSLLILNVDLESVVDLGSTVDLESGVYYESYRSKCSFDLMSAVDMVSGNRPLVY